MTGRKRVSWAAGAVYAVPLGDGSYGLAQAIDAMMVNVIYVALFAARVPELPAAPPPLRREAVVALTATWRQHLNRGDWPYIGEAATVVRKGAFPSEQFAKAGYVGARHYDAGLLAKFLAAYHGLLPWNVMHVEDYYDRLLAPGVSRPAAAVLLDPAARAAYRAEKFGIDPDVTSPG